MAVYKLIVFCLYLYELVVSVKSIKIKNKMTRKKKGQSGKKNIMEQMNIRKASTL